MNHRNNAFKKPTSRSASRNSSQVTVPLQKVCPQSDTQSLKMHCTTKQEKCRKLQPGESQKYPFTISQHFLNPSTKSSLFLMRLGFYMLRSWLCSPLWISDTAQHYFESMVAQPYSADTSPTTCRKKNVRGVPRSASLAQIHGGAGRG